MLSCHGASLLACALPTDLTLASLRFVLARLSGTNAFYAFVVDGFVGFISTPCPPLGKKPLLLLTRQ